MPTSSLRLRTGVRRCAVWLTAWLLAAPAYAGMEVLVVLSGTGGIYTDTYHSLRKHLNNNDAFPVRLSMRTLPPPEATPLHKDELTEAHLVITVGAEAAGHVLGRDNTAPVLCILIPSATYAALRGAHRDTPGNAPASSAIYLDHPLDRQLNLIRLALPGRSTIGVLLGPTSSPAREALQAAAARNGLSLWVQEMAPDGNPVAALSPLLDQSQVLLALPDPLVYNRFSLQGVLLTTYRRRVPVIAFSAGHVRAGALAAIHSTPEQIARQTAEVVRDLARQEERRLPDARHPDYYTVSVNRQVAHSLGLSLPAAADLQRRLELLERQAQ